MSKILKRPMFRRGGNVGTGIMSGVVDRSMHAEQPFVGNQQDGDWSKRYLTKMLEAAGPYQGADPLTAYLLQAGPQIAQSTSWTDMLGNLEGANKALIDAQNKRAEWERNIKTGATQLGLEREMKEDLLKQEWDARKDIARMNTEEKQDPFKIASYETFRKGGDSHTVATNKANYDVDFEAALNEKIGRDRVGGIIDIDITDKEKFKKWATSKRGGSKLNKVFYDPRDGKFKQLLQTEEGITFRVFGNTVESVTLKDTVKVKTPVVKEKREIPDAFSPEIADAMA